MRLNPECIKDVLLCLDSVMLPDEYGDIEEIRPEAVTTSSTLEKYQQSELFYHIKQMFKTGLLEKGDQYINQDIAAIAGITPTGYQFLDASKNASLWSKVLSTVKTYGSIALPKLIELALDQLPT